MHRILQKIFCGILGFVLLGGAVFAGELAESFFALGKAYERISLAGGPADAKNLDALKAEENALVRRLLADEKELETVAARADTIERALLDRLIERVKFEMTQEGRSELGGVIESLSAAAKNYKRSDCKYTKMINLGGRVVNMSAGRWHETAQGKYFWVSSEYPDIVLSPAEYRRYAASAQKQ